MARTARSLFWVEPEQLAALARRAGAGAPARTPAARETRPREMQQGRERETPFAPPEGSSEDRMEALLDWLDRLTGSRGSFVADNEGLALVSRGVGDKLPALATAMCGTWSSLCWGLEVASEGTLVLELAPGERLHLIPATTAWGLMSLGFVTADVLPSETLKTVQETFRRTVETPPGNVPVQR